MSDHAPGLRAQDFTIRGTESADGEVLYLFCPDDRCNWHGVSDDRLALGRLLEVAARHLGASVDTADLGAAWIA